MTDDVPHSLGRYVIEEEIGRGMMGVVYRAKDPALGRVVALKTVRLAFAVPQEQREGYEKRFMAEARVAAVLSHPGIVVVHDVGRDPDAGTLYIALEFLQGETLADQLNKSGPMESERALKLTSELAEALHHAHSHGIVHRDIKPANIMVLTSGAPKIMDFGIAKIPASDLTAAGEFFGTPSYMSPEQASGQAVDGRSDLFSLGAVLYVLLTGRRPFDAPSMPAIFNQVLHKDPEAPSSLVPGLGEGVDKIVARALAKDPESRYRTGREMAEDIGALLGGTSPEVESSRAGSLPFAALQAAPTAQPPPRGFPYKTVLGALLALALAGAAALFLRSGGGGAGSSTGLTLPSFEVPTLQPPAPAQGHLQVSFEFSCRTGRLQVFVDDQPTLDEPLEGKVVRKVLNVRFHKGSLLKTVEVPSGEHSVRVQVDADGDSQTRRIRARFSSGTTRRLVIGLGGLLKKELSLEWAS